MSRIQSILQIPVRIIQLIFRLALAVMRIILGVFAFLMPRSNNQSKSKMDKYAKEAWVKSGK